MSYGLGSGPNGRTISQAPCANASSRSTSAGPGTEGCCNVGLLSCSQCSLVKYCSGRCQRQHWPKHRLDCQHPYANPQWDPEWIVENRHPLTSESKFLPSSSAVDVYKNTGYPPYDLLQLRCNEGLREEGLSRDYKICMAAAPDIRNLIETVNALPSTYTGKLDILLNSTNALTLNRMLVVLCALLTPGPSLDESAELATHLLYSASLPDTAASYLRYCVNLIYHSKADSALIRAADNNNNNTNEMSFQTTLKTRGRGKLYSAQPAASVKRPMEMFASTYTLAKAMGSMKETLLDPFQVDDREKVLAMLTPQHRLALNRFWHTGVLAPFSLDLRGFKAPNRLMFTPQGEWLGYTSAINPLHGWDVTSIRRSGLRHGVNPTGDILGALFFHLKSELRQFSLRMKELDISIHLLQYDSRLLSKGISIGVLPAFSEAAFDRIDVGDMGDQLQMHVGGGAGVAECLADWGPLLNKNNEHASLIMHSKRWHEDAPGSIARDNPRSIKVLMVRCESVPSLKSKLKNIFKTPQTPSLIRLMASLDAFVDHEAAFLQYLEAQAAQSTAETLGLTLRQRVGIPLDAEHQKLPNLSKEEFYDLFTIGGSDLTIRFAEFQCSNFA
ncbi:hypothetical protein CPB84DRAFT_1817000 [Gymnopilus junonius]|uniref:MYND-type domain-containing protein n=1 Tax=Gymnopilus junonius TaxID=109634 RepID=A0A9P5NF52_GYMJU|nr:hypothetical protein CPB84DRAFT_1817000 [Gymnopilus junonius]